MNVKLLHFKCQTVVRAAYKDYRNDIENAIFDVDDSIIEIELNAMTHKIGIDMGNWCSDCNYSEKQKEYAYHVLNYYVTIALKKAKQFGTRHKVSKA